MRRRKKKVNMSLLKIAGEKLPPSKLKALRFQTGGRTRTKNPRPPGGGAKMELEMR